MFFTPFENSGAVKVYTVLQDLTLLCLYQCQDQYLLPQKTSFYCGLINNKFGFINNELGLQKILKVTRRGL